MAKKPKFTRIPKTADLTSRGVPTEVIPTYCALTDYAHNRTGKCWPSMQRLALTLNRSVRTIQRHLHLLKELGLIEFLERRRYKGRFSSYLYRVVHITLTTGHTRPAEKPHPNRDRTKHSLNTPKPPIKTREEMSRRRKEGYEWLFQ